MQRPQGNSHSILKYATFVVILSAVATSFSILVFGSIGLVLCIIFFSMFVAPKMKLRALQNILFAAVIVGDATLAAMGEKIWICLALLFYACYAFWLNYPKANV